MSTVAPIAGPWVRAGLIALPVYGLVLAYTTRVPQPDQETEPVAWAEFVSSTTYLVEHVASSVVGPLLVIAGTAALGAFLAHGDVARPAVWGAVLAVAGQVLFMVPGTIATFGTPPIGAAYLDGHREVMEIEFSGLLGVLILLALVLVVAGNAVLGVAVWRSALPRWTGALWVVATLLFYVLGAALGMLTTGASLLTQSAGGLLMAISSAGMAAAVLRTTTAPTTVRA